VHIVQVGDERVDRTEKTRDISSGGVCFLSPTSVEVGGRIEYLITLPGTNPPVRIHCLGKVVRSRQPNTPEQSAYEVAVTMERYHFVRPDEFDAASVTV